MTTLHGEQGLPRFHYRHVAAEHAIQAAELVPRRSQAYASLLCHGAMWTGNRVEETLYERYVKHGAAMPGMTAFGGRCPEPSWSGAARLQARQTLRDAAPWLHRHPYRSAGAAALIVAAAIAAFIVRRRRRAA